MSTPTIHIQFHGPAFAVPGGRLAGKAQWSNLPKPSEIRIRLYWLMQNKKGGHDLGIVAEQPVPFASSSGQFDFEFPLPDGPCTFEGRLLRLGWGVEAVAGKLAGRATFVLGPGGTPIQLNPIEDETPKLPGWLHWLKPQESRHP